jgi:hypothetical protein
MRRGAGPALCRGPSGSIGRPPGALFSSETACPMNPWVRVLLVPRSITSTTWGHEAWPEVKPVLRRALEMRRQIAREGWWN